ncbi:MAG: DNA-processing protein DprA [Patescibacteria group bacterium]|jgi:DNA processing protein
MDNQNTDHPNRLAALGFSYFRKVGSQRWRLLETYFTGLAEAFAASGLNLMAAGWSEKLTKDFISWRQSFAAAIIINELAKDNIGFITWHDQRYPRQLKTIADPPPILYYKGDIGLFEKKGADDCLAVVGSRQCSAYGAQAIKTLIPNLVQCQIKIISGLALGLDTLAHRAALKDGGKTIAVLGSGLNRKNIYPTQNLSLADEIINSGGLLLSEFPPDTPPYRQNFPRRNRLIAGLARATLVIEAPEKSGALTTAEYAKSQNRQLVVVPGAIFSRLSRGSNELIKEGARAVMAASDILRIFVQTMEPPAESDKLSKNPAREALSHFKNPDEKTVYGLIELASGQGEVISADQIIRDSQLDTATINSTLSILELAGKIRLRGSGYELNIVI